MKVVLTAIGHLGRDCSIRYIENGNAAINFTIAATERYKDKQGNKCEHTTWIDCTIWRKPDNIKIAEYLKKGQLVEITGRPETRGYRSKEDANVIHSSLQCRVDNLLLLGGLKKSDSDQSSGQNNETFTATTQEDDLPF